MISMYSIFDNMNDGICIFNKKGYLRYINETSKKILGIEKKRDLNGKKIIDLIDLNQNNDRFLQVFLDSLTEKSATENLIDFQKPDGTLRQIRVSVFMVESVSKEVEPLRIMLLTDYTELVKVRSVLERYTSKDIAKVALEEPGGDKRGGKLVDASILFCDIRGYTSISKELTPTSLVDLINHYYSIMELIITKYHGTIMEFLGDGIFAAFGILSDDNDKNHALNAVSCAIEMQNAMIEENLWNISFGYPPIEIGIGINSGNILAGNIGSKNTMKYQCIGHDVNLAARIESFTVGGQVLISENTYKRISDHVEYKSLQTIHAKGISEPVNVYDIISAKGEYSISIKQEEIELKPLKTPIPVLFSMLNNKKVEETEYNALIVKISDKSAQIATDDYKLNTSDNILLKYQNSIYAKVTDVTDDGYIIRFLSSNL